MPLESDLDKRIADLVKSRGGYHAKLHGSALQPGLPDHLIGYKGAFVYVEAKAGSKLRPGQRLHLRRARAAGNIAEVAWDTDIVARILDAVDRGEPWVPETTI